MHEIMFWNCNPLSPCSIVLPLSEIKNNRSNSSDGAYSGQWFNSLKEDKLLYMYHYPQPTPPPFLERDKQ